ncbi:hypothetical protein Hte_008114 [Hypoxylon texense]
MNAKLPLLKSFLEHGQDIVYTICRVLATQLSLPPDSFTSLQSPSKPSGTVIRLLKAYACPSAEDLRTSLVHHTDFGTITLLANVVGGLPPKESDSDAWLWVRPQPGCLIMSLGDAMVEWTGGLLRSNVHRVRYPPGQQRFLDRYSVALLTKLERDAIMKNLVRQDEESRSDDTGNLKAWEWRGGVKKTSALMKGDETVESKGGIKT